MYFCSAPFTHMTINPHGVTVPCLSGRWLSQTGGDLSQESVAQAWNAPECQEVRSSILDGSFRYCREDSCPFLRLKNGPIQRRAEVSDPYLLEVIRENKVYLDRMPVSVGLAYDPTCDLACRHCHLEPSQLAPEAKPVFDLVHEKAWDFLPTVEDAWLSFDGEPFVSTYYFRGMREFKAREGRFPRLHLFTNATRFTPENWEAISAIHPAIHEVHVNLGTAKESTYRSYQGGDYTAVMENLQFIARLKRDGAPWPLTYRFVVHARNYREMAAYRRLAGDLSADKVAFTSVTSASVPDDEYAALAIHKPDHPEYDYLLAMLDEVENTEGPECNLMEYLMEILYQEPDTWPAEVSFEECCEILDLGPKSERDTKNIIRGYREELVKILGQPDANGAIPLDALAIAFTGHDAENFGANNMARASDLAERRNAAGILYGEQMRDAYSAAHAQIQRTLTIYQRARLNMSPYASLVEARITPDPFDVECARRAEALEHERQSLAPVFQLGAMLSVFLLWTQMKANRALNWVEEEQKLDLRSFGASALSLVGEIT